MLRREIKIKIKEYRAGKLYLSYSLILKSRDLGLKCSRKLSHSPKVLVSS